ncbi:hypothetical protein [Gilliamella sp.]|uniref:hypothetical protein n=1 Tax=Gilliamella sp. TaxID=1891236 RepID=UPI0025F9EC3C|nr:hypothetical protein [Gilliamella sp.]
MCKFYNHERYVTIYHYDEKDKYFTHHEENCYQPAGIGLPANSTDIPVPDGELPSGFIYVFENEQWTAKKDVFKKNRASNMSEENYIYQENLPPYFTIGTFDFHKMPQYEKIENFTNPQLQSLILTYRYLHIQNEFIEVIDFHEKYVKNIQNIGMIFPQDRNPAIMYRLKTESLILSIRSLFDELVQLTYITCYKSIFIKDSQIKVDCIGDLFSPKKVTNYPLCKKIILGDDINYQQDSSGFLKMINNLFNSIKHSFIHYEVYNSFPPETPNVISLYKKQNDFSSGKVIFFNHSLFQIMFGFKCNFNRIINNQKEFLLNRK